MTDAPTTLNKNSAKEVKGKFGQYLEKYYFGIENNSISEPDFKEAKLELKSTPIKRLNNGTYTPKERLVLNIIDYCAIIEEKWETSHFLSKNELLLLILYLYETDKNFLDYLIRYVTLWKIEGADREMIRQDWEKIVSKIKSGKAHELSEGETFYLGACRKGWKEEPRKQPNSPIRAPQRAFSFKVKYMSAVLKRLEDSQKLITDISELKKNSFENLVYNKFQPFLNMNIKNIEQKLHTKLNRKSKGYYADLARRMMGVSAKYIEEFEKAGVSMKIIRLKHNGVPKEDMSFPYFKYKEIAEQEWDESNFSEQLESKFFFVVYQMNKDESKIFFKKAFFWNMPITDMAECEAVWIETKKRIISGKADTLPKKIENRVSHVRPHARNKQDTDIAPNGKLYVKKCFWLNSKYLKEQIENN
jgi:DNA mismatch repair protein MutH